MLLLSRYPMNKENQKIYLPLPAWARWLSGVLGLALIVSAAALYFNPPARVTSTDSSSYTGSDRHISQETVEVEPASIVVVLFLTGVALMLFGVNGLKITSLSTKVVDVGFESRDVKVSDPAVAASTSQESEQVNRTHSELSAQQFFEALIGPMIPPDVRPASLPPQIPLGPHDVRFGQTISIETQRLTNLTGIFYFSHDAMLCFAALLCNVPHAYVFGTARQAKNHLEGIGFGSTPLLKQLENIMVEFDIHSTAPVSTERRQALAAELFDSLESSGMP